MKWALLYTEKESGGRFHQLCATEAEAMKYADDINTLGEFDDFAVAKVTMRRVRTVAWEAVKP